MYIPFSVKDCSLFAIAFAMEVGDPAVVSYQQTEMRKHLVSCFDKGELPLLPRANKAASVCSREILSLKMWSTLKL